MLGPLPVEAELRIGALAVALLALACGPPEPADLEHLVVGGQLLPGAVQRALTQQSPSATQIPSAPQVMRRSAMQATAPCEKLRPS